MSITPLHLGDRFASEEQEINSDIAYISLQFIIFVGMHGRVCISFTSGYVAAGMFAHLDVVIWVTWF